MILIINGFDEIINQFGMLAEEKERSYHSEDKRRSVSRDQARKFQMEKVKMRFKNIASRIKQIKNENSSDITQLTTLMRGSEQIEKMAHQSLQKATLFLSQSKLQKKRVTSPNFHEAKHAHPHTQEFNPPTNQQQNIPLSVRTEYNKRKARVGKNSVVASHIKTDETSESQAQKEYPIIEKISEIQIHQQYSGIRQELPEEAQKQAHNEAHQEEGHANNDHQHEEREASKVQEQKLLRQSTSSPSLLNKSGSRYLSTQGSMRASLKRSTGPANNRKRKTQSIFPYIAIIIFSIIFLLVLRG